MEDNHRDIFLDLHWLLIALEKAYPQVIDRADRQRSKATTTSDASTGDSILELVDRAS